MLPVYIHTQSPICRRPSSTVRGGREGRCVKSVTLQFRRHRGQSRAAGPDPGTLVYPRSRERRRRALSMLDQCTDCVDSDSSRSSGRVDSDSSHSDSPYSTRAEYLGRVWAQHGEGHHRAVCGRRLGPVEAPCWLRDGPWRLRVGSVMARGGSVLAP